MTSPSKQLNLRYKPVSQELLRSPAHEGIEKLWIGPSHSISPLLVVQSLPTSLQHLDWDMTGDGVSIQTEVLDALFQKQTLRHLCLRFRGDDGAVQLSKHLATALHLESLDLRGNYITDIGAQALASALQGSRLVSLNLGYNRIGDDGIKALSQVLSKSCCQLEQLNLSCNTFGPQGTAHLAQALRKNRSLKELSLFCNHISYASCVELAESLNSHNYTLERLKLGGTLTDTFSDVRLCIEHFLKLNRGGRHKLRDFAQSREEWLAILADASGDLDMLFTFVSNKPDVIRR